MNSKDKRVVVFPDMDINLDTILSHVRILRDGKYSLIPVVTRYDQYREEDHMTGTYGFLDPTLAVNPDGVKYHVLNCYTALLLYTIDEDNPCRDMYGNELEFLDENQEDEKERMTPPHMKGTK